MTLAQARKQLEFYGFNFPTHARCIDRTLRWGYQSSEPYNTGKDEFRAKFRDVFIAKTKTGFYVTSHIKGTMRRYRSRTWHETDIANIFGHGTTLQMAIDQFITNFVSLNYNITK